MQYFKLFCCFLFIGLLISPLISFSQITDKAPKTTTSSPEDTTTTVEILPGVRKLEFRKINDSTQLQILAGNVKLKQGKTYFDCDSCVINNNSHTFEAWGRVHINDSDTANAYASHLLYYINKKNNIKSGLWAQIRFPYDFKKIKAPIENNTPKNYSTCFYNNQKKTDLAPILCNLPEAYL